MNETALPGFAGDFLLMNREVVDAWMREIDDDRDKDRDEDRNRR
jgi:hypothetical protein